MATISKSWSNIATVYESHGYGGGNATITTATAYSDNIPLEANGYEGAQVEITATPSGSTDNFNIYIYANVATLHDEDEQSIFSQQFSNDTEVIHTIVIKDIVNFRVGMTSDGSTDSYQARVTYKAWRWTSA